MVHKVIIVSVRVLYVGFSISLVLVFRFRVFGFSGFRVFGFSGFQVLRFLVFRFFGQDGTASWRDATISINDYLAQHNDVISIFQNLSLQSPLEQMYL